MADYYLDSSVAVLYAVSTTYTLGQRVLATSGQTAARKQRIYEVTTGGLSAGSEPAWNTTVGGTTVSGAATFTCRNPVTWADANGYFNYLCGAVLAAGDRIFVKNTHSESLPALGSQNTIGTTANPVQLICVSDAGEPPTTLATGALIASTAAMNIGSGMMYAYGIEFRSGNGGSATANIEISNSTPSVSGILWAEECTFNLSSSGGASLLRPYGSVSLGNGLWMKNCTINFGAAGASIGNLTFSQLIMRGGSFTGTAPTTAFTISSSNIFEIFLEGVDLSLVTGTLFGLNGATDSKSVVTLRTCKLNAAVTIFGTNRTGDTERNWTAVNCSDDTKNYRIAVRGAVGDLVEESSIIHSGGASDGTTPISWKVVTTASAKRGVHFYTQWIGVWNEAVGGAKTLTVEIVHDSATALKDNEVWLEVEYLGSTLTPVSTLITDASDVLAAGASQDASSVTWNGMGGFSNPNKQALAVTFTPEMKGLFRARVAVAKASKTLYVDPLITVT